MFPYQQLNQTSPLLAIFGSEDPSQSFLALLDVSTRKWVANATKVNPPKRNSGLVAIGNPIDGKIYIRGGYQSDLCNTMDVYDPKTDTLTPIPIPQPSTGGDIATGGVGVNSSQWYGAVWSDRRNSILYFGGRLGSAAYVPPVIYEYIPATNTWQFLSTTGTGPSGREDPCVAIDEANDNLVVYGGQVTEGLLGDIYVLNLNTLEWKRGPSSSDGRVGMACTIHDDGFLVWGGAKDTFLLNIYSSEPGVFNLSTQLWTSTYKMTTPPELIPPVETPKRSTLGLVLGLTMGGIAVGAVGAGMLLYKREKKKSDKSGQRLKRIVEKSPSVAVPSETSGNGPGPVSGYTNNKVHEEPSLPLEAHHRHRRNPSSGLEKKKSHVHFTREYDSSLGSTEDERNESREWGDGASRRKTGRRKKDLGMSIGHKIEMPMGPDNTYVQEHEHDHVYYDNKMEDPTFRAPSNMEESLAIVSIYGPSSFYALPSSITTNQPSLPVYTLKVSLEEPDFEYDPTAHLTNANTSTTTGPHITSNKKELELRIYFPEGYPETNSSPPVHEIVSIYYGTLRLTSAMIQEIDQGLEECFVPGEVVVFAWIEWLRSYLEQLELEGASEDEEDEDEDEEEEHGEEGAKELSDYFQGDTDPSAMMSTLSLSSPSNTTTNSPKLSTVPGVFKIQTGAPIVDRKSVFVAHLAPITQAGEVPWMIQQLKQENKKVVKATHNIMAFRVENENGTIAQGNKKQTDWKIKTTVD
ncbi:hypothetical protein BGZ52_008803 [Haplosporangium bisporale]|nr:hypothetical protein BGZ52_008803 [Haplosporangium bisporale]